MCSRKWVQLIDAVYLWSFLMSPAAVPKGFNKLKKASSLKTLDCKPGTCMLKLCCIFTCYSLNYPLQFIFLFSLLLSSLIDWSWHEKTCLWGLRLGPEVIKLFPCWTQLRMKSGFQVSPTFPIFPNFFLLFWSAPTFPYFFMKMPYYPYFFTLKCHLRVKIQKFFPTRFTRSNCIT